MNDRKRAVRYGVSFVILAVLFDLFIYMECKFRKYPPLCEGDPEYHIPASGR